MLCPSDASESAVLAENRVSCYAPATSPPAEVKSLMKKLIVLVSACLLLAFATASAETAPSTVIHVVTVSWKEDASKEQIQAALDGVRTLAEEFEGITRVWTKTLSAQGNRSAAFVMEFRDEAALKAYAGSDAQKQWYEHYIPVRGGSTTFDITN